MRIKSNHSSSRQRLSFFPATIIVSGLHLLGVPIGLSASAADAVETFEKRVAKKEHDAEESSATGRVHRKSTDLELTDDNGAQIVGIRFEKVKVPRGSFIQNAYIQFAVDEPGSIATSLSIYGEYSKDAKKYSEDRFDISSRTKTSAVASWTPPTWPTVGAQGADQRTPNLASLVQEVIDHPEWKKDKPIAFIIEGAGRRTAESRDGSKNNAPLLHIEYGDEPVDPPLASWTPLDIRFNGLAIGEDTANKRLLVPLPAGYETFQNFTATIDYQPLADGYALAFNNDAPITSGSSYNFGAVEYGSQVEVQLYRNDQFVDDYTLVFTNLPVIELEAATIVDEPKSPGSFTLNAGTAELSVGKTAMGIEFRGATSQAFPKKSFGLELVEDDDPTDEKNIPLLGFRNDGDWILDAAYRDTSFVRNIVGHDIYNSMRPFAFVDGNGDSMGQAAIRGTQVEVILNERYHGVYILSERVDRKLLDVQKIDVPEDAQGNELWDQVDFSDPENGSVIYKADANGATLFNLDTVRIDFEQEYPDADDIVYYAPLEELIQYLNSASDAEFIATVGNLVDIDSVVDFWLLTNVTSDSDTLKKNYFLARSGAGKWFFVPWDKDASFDMWWTGRRVGTFNRWEPQKNNLIRRLIELPASGFNTRVKARYNELRGSIFSETALAARFANYNAGVVPVAGNSINARSRNFVRWPESGGEGVNDPELGTVDYISNWIIGRMGFLDVRIAAQPE
ncbi:MAG: CotH kinase family protein [Pseudomonadales bacterium]